MREIESGTELVCDDLMASELGAVVRRQRKNLVLERGQHLDNAPGYGICILARDLVDEGVSGSPFDHCHQHVLSASGRDNGVQLPVAYARPFFDDGRAFVDVCLVRDYHPLARAVLFAAQPILYPEVLVQRAP